MTYWGMAASGLGGGLAQLLNAQNQQQDIQALSQQLGVQTPQMQSPQARALALSGLQQALMPMNPLQRSQMMENYAQTQLLGAQLGQVGMPTPMTEGERLRLGLEERKFGFQKEKPFYQPGIIENTVTGKQRPYTYGEEIPEGYKIVREAQTVVNLGAPASAAERTAIAETRASIDNLNNLKELFDSLQTKTGPITGRLEPVKGLFGLSTDEQEAFMAATSAFKNAIIKEITGAQMSEVEAERIMKQVPDITDPPTRWRAKWQQSKKNLEMLQKRRMEILGQSGLRVPSSTKAESMTIESIDKELADINRQLEELK
jgi:hypothetical protein